MAGRLTGTLDGRPVVIDAGENGVMLDVSTFRSAWQLRGFVKTALPILHMMKCSHIPLTLRVAGVVPIVVLPKAGLLVTLFAPALAKA